MRGKIVKVDKKGGWGFISSFEVPFTRIFFHWVDLKSSTKNMLELKRGMDVEFEVIDHPYKNKNNDKEVIGKRAIKIEVIDDALNEADVEKIK